MSHGRDPTTWESSPESVDVLNVFADVYTDEMAGTIAERDEIAASLADRTGGAVTMTTTVPDGGAASLEDPLDVVTNAPYIIDAVQNYDGAYDAIVVDCFGDPAVDALRQVVDVPVVGVNQASCSVATQLGRTFSIVPVLDEISLLLNDLASKYGFDDQLASIRPIDIGVIELEQQPERTAAKIAREAKAAVTEDGAHSIVLGCTGMNGVRREAASRLADDGIDVPVIEPLSAGIQTAVMLHRLGQAQSKVAYRPPREKERVLHFDVIGTNNERK